MALRHVIYCELDSTTYFNTLSIPKKTIWGKRGHLAHIVI